MEHQDLVAPSQPRPEQVAPVQGPCELDPSVFALVVGGAPYGGGWQRAVVECAPHGGSW